MIRELKNILDERLNKLKGAVFMLQKACPHDRVNKAARSNTGNYDLAADCYWFDVICPDCDKRWQEDQ